MPDPAPQRVLIVDDEADIVAVLRDFLVANLHVDVVEAQSGKDALAKLDSNAVDLIITDYKMPGMDGLEFLRLVAAKLPDVPRTMMTAYPDLELAISALNEGSIIHFFSKPLVPEELLGVIGAILDERRARKQRKSALDRSLDMLRRRGAPG